MWFKKQKKQPHTNAVQDQLASRIAVAIIHVQRKLSQVVSCRVSLLTVARIKALLIFFWCLGSGSSIYLVANAIRNRDEKQGVIPVERLQKTGHVSKAGDESMHPNASVSKETYHRFQDFRRYMDSLRQDLQERKMYDSLLLARPYLLDSILVLETIYQSQHKH